MAAPSQGTGNGFGRPAKNEPATLTDRLPPKSISVHPSPTSGAVVSWKSPIAGAVRITGRIADGDPVGGDGVVWHLDHRTASGGSELAAGEIPNGGSQALALKIDVTARAQVDDMVTRAIAAFGGVQFLFNSAGAAIRRAKFLEIDDALLEKTFALNVNGTFYAMQAVLPHMLGNKHGVIVNMASMAHRRGGPGS